MYENPGGPRPLLPPLPTPIIGSAIVCQPAQDKPYTRK